MYEVINEKLKLESCSIGDLTLNIVNGMLKSWNDGSSISTLTIFYSFRWEITKMKVLKKKDL